jgi:hypothetical protein
MPDRLHSTLHFIQADGIPSGLNILYRVSCPFLFSLIFCRVRLRIQNRAAPRDDPTLAFPLYYVHIAGKAKGSTGRVLLQLLEMRLDNILFRLGMASTIPGARQLVNHRIDRHIIFSRSSSRYTKFSLQTPRYYYYEGLTKDQNADSKFYCIIRPRGIAKTFD